MLHINYCNKKHLWTPNVTEDKSKFTFQQVIDEFYKSGMLNKNIIHDDGDEFEINLFSKDKKHEEFLFYQNGNLLLDHDLKVRAKGPYKNSDEIFML